jgi:hypothetical protein
MAVGELETAAANNNRCAWATDEGAASVPEKTAGKIRIIIYLH